MDARSQRFQPEPDAPPRRLIFQDGSVRLGSSGEGVAAVVTETYAPFLVLRRVWIAGTVAMSLAAFALAIALAPAGSATPGRALGALLVLGSSVHVAATGWFYTLPEVREHARAHRIRYVVAPGLLIAVTAVVSVLIPYGLIKWALLAYFAWQFFHFQKQNLGMAALAGASAKSGSLTRLERQAIVIAGLGGIGGLIVHPDLLQLGLRRPLADLYPAAFAVFLAGVFLGLFSLVRRERRRGGAFVTIYLISLLFFAPVFIFHSPYAAVAGLTIAHGAQYLLIVGLIAGAPRTDRPGVLGLVLLVAIAGAGGLFLNVASHLHGSPQPFERALYGAYLGAVMAHFVIDAGLWRLRDEFPRRFLTASLPYLLKP